MFVAKRRFLLMKKGIIIAVLIVSLTAIGSGYLFNEKDRLLPSKPITEEGSGAVTEESSKPDEKGKAQEEEKSNEETSEVTTASSNEVQESGYTSTLTETPVHTESGGNSSGSSSNGGSSGGDSSSGGSSGGGFDIGGSDEVIDFGTVCGTCGGPWDESANRCWHCNP